jgi:hypothetical protein
MASCDVNALLVSARCFMCLSEKQLDMVTAQLMQQWAGNTQTANELLSDARCMNCLDTKQIDLIQTQLLCDIAG